MKKIKEYFRLFLSQTRSYKQQKSEINFRARDLAFLIPHTKKCIPRYVSFFFILILSSGLGLLSPAITGYIFDTVFVSKNASNLNLLVGLLLAILILSEIIHFIQEYLRLRLSQEFTFSIRIQLIERILKYPLSFFKDFKTGYLVSRMNEVNLLGSFFSVTILSMAGSMIKFSGAIFLISRYNLKLTLIAMFVLPLFFEISRRSVGAIRASSIGAMESEAMVRGKIQETLSGIEIVKTYAKEKRETSEIKSGLRNMIEMEIVQNLFSSLAGRILGLITGVNLLVILWVGGYEIIAGRLTVGQYVAFVAYIGFLYGPIQMFAITFLQFQRAFMACKRISSFLDKTAEDECQERKHEFRTIDGNIQFKNVCFHYNEGKDVLHDINFSIRRGEKIGFVGKSGAGKSTLVHLILGLYEPTSGLIKIDGIDVQTIKLESLRNRIGIVSQNIFLFDDSILNNIKYSRPDASIEEVFKAAKASGCHDFISKFSQGYETSVGEIGKKLSGGEKQRISIARCLLKKPDLIIFDEPTAHLDPEAIKAQIDSFRELFKDKTCIIISHHLNNIHWMDRIFFLEDGCVVQEGTHADLIKKAGKYHELFESNLR